MVVAVATSDVDNHFRDYRRSLLCVKSPSVISHRNCSLHPRCVGWVVGVTRKCPLRRCCCARLVPSSRWNPRSIEYIAPTCCRSKAVAGFPFLPSSSSRRLRVVHYCRRCCDFRIAMFRDLVAAVFRFDSTTDDRASRVGAVVDDVLFPCACLPRWWWTSYGDDDNRDDALSTTPMSTTRSTAVAIASSRFARTSCAIRSDVRSPLCRALGRF